MATIRKRSWTSGGEAKTAWLVAYVDQHGQRRQRQFARRREADTFMVKARAEVALGTHMPESTSSTVAEAAACWLASAEARGLERTTLEGYRQHVDRIVPDLGALKVAQVNVKVVADFRDRLLRTVSRALAAKVMVTLRSMLKAAGRPIDVRLEQQQGRHRTRLEVGRGIPTPEQVRALLAASAHPARAILALAALAGLRASEIRGLCWGDLDLQGGSVTVRQRADRFGQIGSPKSEDARRTVPIGPELVRILKEWRLASDPGNELVFATRRGTPHLLGNLRRRVLDGVPLHAFRHFYASWSLERGVPLTTLQRRMGHSTILLTADRYGHLLETSADERRDLAAAEARLLCGKDAARGARGG